MPVLQIIVDQAVNSNTMTCYWSPCVANTDFYCIVDYINKLKKYVNNSLTSLYVCLLECDTNGRAVDRADAFRMERVVAPVCEWMGHVVVLGQVRPVLLIRQGHAAVAWERAAVRRICNQTLRFGGLERGNFIRWGQCKGRNQWLARSRKLWMLA